MDVTFQTGIGVPASFKVKYDEESKLLKGYTDRRRLRSCCKIISVDFKLKLLFTVAEGNFIGFEYYCLPELLPEVNLTKPFILDGFVKLDLQPGMIKRVNVVSFNKAEAKYDKEAKLLLIGEEKEELAFYRICKNMSFGVDLSGKLCCILIEIRFF
ncbi:MAG: hypothetical protein ACI4MQ_07630 [Candidatus Coproplasma sp.]